MTQRARYLKELKDSGEAITPKAWQREIDQLAAGKQTDTLAMKSMREDLKAVERLRKTADQLSRQERDKPHDRGRSGKGVAYPCRSHFTTYLCTEKPPYRFPHTAADCLFAEQVAVCAGAGQRQHQNIILYAVDKQPVRENDIPDGLPIRRTGHGHGSYPAAVRPSPAMLRPAPAAQSSSHA